MEFMDHPFACMLAWLWLWLILSISSSDEDLSF
jgi:hypothetical protein